MSDSETADRTAAARRGPPPLAIGRKPIPAWSVSLAVHLIAILVVAYALRFAPRGAGTGEPDRTVGVALVREASGEREYVTREQAQQQSEAAAAAAAAAQRNLPETAQLQVDLSSVLAATDVGGGAAESLLLPASGGAGTPSGGLPGQAQTTRTTVFGVSGTGHRFVYVFDRSGSMAGFGGRPLAAAKRELTASLEDLSENNQFQIIFYNEDPNVFRVGVGRPQLVWANEVGTSAAKRFVRGIQAAGSTRHLEPLRMALGMNPDVIFFLTDADEPQLSSVELRKIQRWNRGCAINTIEFGFGPQRRQDNFLVRLAQQNAGQHVYVDVSALRRN